MGLVLIRCSGLGPHLAVMGEPRGFSRVAAAFSSYDAKITADSDCSHEIKRHLLLGRKAMTNLDVAFSPGKEQAAGVWETCLAPG